MPLPRGGASLLFTLLTQGPMGLEPCAKVIASIKIDVQEARLSFRSHWSCGYHATMLPSSSAVRLCQGMGTRHGLVSALAAAVVRLSARTPGVHRLFSLDAAVGGAPRRVGCSRPSFCEDGVREVGGHSW